MDDTDSQEIVVDFGKICRLCLTGDGVLISLFPTDSRMESEAKTIPDKIMDLMSIVLIKNDGFPPWICHNCLSLVDKCYEFFDQCRTNQVALNESYIAALSDAGVNISSMKVEYAEDVEPEVKPKEEVTKMCNYTDVKVEPNQQIENVLKEEIVGEQLHCDNCSKDFNSFDEYVEHQMSIHPDDDDELNDSILVCEKSESAELYSCDICGAKFHNKNAITAHIRFKHLKVEKEHSADLDKLMVCKYCGLSCSRKNISRHLEVVHRMTKNTETDQRDLGSFDCRICYRPFMRQSSLRSHIEKVHRDNLQMMADVENCQIVWNCSECDSAFLEEVYLVQHYGSKHSKYPLEVDALRGLKSRNLICACGVISSNSFDVALHGIFHHPESSRDKCECPGCEKVLSGANELQVHLIAYHWFSSMSYDNECIVCGQPFKSNDALRLHLNEVHEITFEKNILEENKLTRRRREEESPEEIVEGDKQVGEYPCVYMCETCGELYDTEPELQAHAKVCPFVTNKCELCGKGYKTINLLKRHVAEFHQTLAPIKCPLCPKIFPRKMNLHHHYKRRHLKQAKKFVCSYCGQSLKGIVALRSHEDRLHRNIRNYKCSDCPEAFTTRGILRRHALRHLAERPMLQCQFCDKKFSTISGIERHIKTHEGVKEFQCDTPLCGKSFYTKSELKRHIKFHTRDFKHVCTVCNHKFMSPGELKKHSTKHTGERPFKCHLCSCAYARRDDKVKHLKRVHNLKVKRVYGKSLVKSSANDSDLVDTIVIDESCVENAGVVVPAPQRT